MLLVGNHSGGNMAPDTIVFTLAFVSYFESSDRSSSWPTTWCSPCPTCPGCRSSAPSLPHTPTPSGRWPPAPRCSSTQVVIARSTGPSGNRRGSTSEVARASWTWPSPTTCPSCRWWPSGLRRLRCSCPAVSASPAPCAWTVSSAQGAAHLPGSALGPERGRLLHPPSTAGQDHHPGARADLSSLRVRSQAGPGLSRQGCHPSDAGLPRRAGRRAAAAGAG